MGKRSREASKSGNSLGETPEKPPTAVKSKRKASPEERKKKKKRKHESPAINLDSEQTEASTREKKKKRKKRGAESDVVDCAAEPNGLPANGKEKKESSKERKTKRDGKKKRHKQESPDLDSEQNGTSQELPSGDAQRKLSAANEREWSGLPVPTTEEVLARLTKKRKAFLHGYATVSLPSGEQLKTLDDESRHHAVASSTGFCHRLLNLLHETIVTANRWTQSESKGDTTSVEEALTNDLIRLKKVPLAKQYIEMTLWKRVVHLNRDHLLAASRLGFGKGLAVTRTANSQGLLLHRDDDPDAEFVSYKTAHMKTIVERFSEDLEKMRKAEDMDEERVRFLLRCLESGASLFGNLKCIERKEQEQR